MIDIERDARRYRFLRDGNAYLPEEQGVTGGEALDELVDWAMLRDGEGFRSMSPELTPRQVTLAALKMLQDRI